ncbi:hypothetical protein HYC85_003629 [Camellia sinensis]|uniref:Uncharacterized protein n=1 Tax=Camellia sinensis TaxID=4442 RepID=A0A7J7HWE4_CAMSI|nr:hypothetical protein HYC85_003629 [Camellia sinensis]
MASEPKYIPSLRGLGKGCPKLPHSHISLPKLKLPSFAQFLENLMNPLTLNTETPHFESKEKRLTRERSHYLGKSTA